MGQEFTGTADMRERAAERRRLAAEAAEAADDAAWAERQQKWVASGHGKLEKPKPRTEGLTRLVNGSVEHRCLMCGEFTPLFGAPAIKISNWGGMRNKRFEEFKHFPQPTPKCTIRRIECVDEREKFRMRFVTKGIACPQCFPAWTDAAENTPDNAPELSIAASADPRHYKTK